jgi:hypothetical protein
MTPDTPERRQSCPGCGEAAFSPNVEAFEMTGALVCDDCFDCETDDDDAEWFS